MNRVPERFQASISADYEARVRTVCNGPVPSALQLRGRLDPKRWALEWSFGRWVGTALGIESGIWREITISNALILASVIWQDDIEDGELAVADRASAERLGSDLFHAAMEPYRALIPGSSPFWPAVDRWMSSWRDATAHAALTHHNAYAPGKGIDLPTLALRGAPLKIPAYGLCLLADRPAAFPALEASIEHAMSGMVLYDHFADWSTDLADGRWNAFVAFALQEHQRGTARISKADVEAMMLAEPVVERYFALITRELTAAEQFARNAGVRDLAEHLHELGRELNEEGESLATRYVTLGAHVTQQIFGRQTVTP